MSKVTSKVASKTESCLPQPLNGKMMIHSDFPLRRPRVHHIFLDTGEHKVVSPEEYEKIQVGDTETVYVDDPPNWRYVALGILVFMVVIFVIVYS